MRLFHETSAFPVRRRYGRSLKLGLAALVICLSWASGIGIADLAATDGPCSTGIAVANPQDDPLLVEDCNTLLAARDTLSGGGRRLIWTVDTPMSKWDGVSIAGSPARVTELRIRGDDVHGRLKGSIPRELGHLTGLVILDLRNNVLSGEIPPELGRLTRLVFFNLVRNALSGDIPSELGGLKALVTMNLEDNSLTGSIPAALGRLSDLYRLDLDNNELTGEIPTELGLLANLRVLGLCDNELTGEIPAELGQLVELRELWLCGTRLGGEIPLELAGLSNLQSLELGTNRLVGNIPEELGDLPNLTWLGLRDNRLTGRIPVELGKLTNLRVLSLGYNELSGNIPAELGELTGLESLSLVGNKLTGGVPPELGKLGRLESLNLTRNKLSGHIPASLGQLANLRLLWLRFNELTGEIPATFGNLTELEVLWLTGNQLSGRIPPELGELRNLDSLALADNQLSGEIPATLGGLTKLRSAHLGNNELHGHIPPELGGLSDLNALYLSGNQLTGEIPAALAVLDNLRSLDLSRNQLTGEIPTALGELTNLTEFWVQGNDLTGCVPVAFSRFISRAFSDTGLRFCFAEDDDPAVVNSTSLLTLGEGGTLTIDESVLLANDLETANSTLRITQVSDVVNGTVSVVGPTITYVHDGSETTTGSFTYAASDAVHLSVATVTLAVTQVNDPPVAVRDHAATDEGATLSIAVAELLANDTDAENDTLTISAVGHAVNGTVSLDGTTIIYQHDGSETTTGNFNYTVTDGTETDTATVNIAVTPVNDPPVAVGDAATLNEGATLSIDAQVLLANDTDAEAGRLTVSAVGDAVNGTVFLDGTTIIYMHDGSETAVGSFTYTVSDGTDTATAMVAVTVTPVNDPPVAVGDTATLDEGGTLSIDASTLLANDADAERDTLTVSGVGDAVNGTVFLDGATIIYKHDGSETTSDSFTYTVSDGPDTATAMVAITVTPVNDPPMAVGDTATLKEGGTLSLTTSELLANDADAENDALTVASVGHAVNGNVFLDGTTITYEHDGAETTSGSFTYTVSDGADAATAMVTITVTPVNDSPEAADDSETVDEGATLSIDPRVLLANDTDADNDLLEIVAVGNAANGTASFDGITISYGHDGSETFMGGFAYTVSDGIDTATAVVAITVIPVNDPPVAANDTATLEEGGTLSITAAALLANDSDAEDARLVISEVGGAVNGNVALDGTTITYRHDGSETTAGSFTYTVSDGADTATAAVTITVTPVNDPPVVAADSATVDEGGTLAIDASALLSNDSDAENATLTISAVGDAANGSVSLDGSTITYEHDGSETIVGRFTYTVTDGSDTATVLVTITVTPVTDLPVVPLIALVVGIGLVTVLGLIVVRVRRTRGPSPTP